MFQGRGETKCVQSAGDGRTRHENHESIHALLGQNCLGHTKQQVWKCGLTSTNREVQQAVKKGSMMAAKAAPQKTHSVSTQAPMRW